ncbi:MAG: hypothetical protein AB8G05_19615 [Oligoflexales bacterium]
MQENKFLKIFFLVSFIGSHLVYAGVNQTISYEAENSFKFQIGLKYDLLNKNIHLFEHGSREEGCSACSQSLTLICCLPSTFFGAFCCGYRKNDLSDEKLIKIIKDDLRNLRNYINGEQVEIRKVKIKVRNPKLMESLKEEFDGYIRNNVDVISYRDQILLFSTAYNMKSFLFNQASELQRGLPAKASEFLDEHEHGNK